MEEDFEDRWERRGRNWRFPKFSLEEDLEDRWEWRGKNWIFSNSPLEDDIAEEWEWREKNSRPPNFSSASRSADILSGSTEEPPHSDFGGSRWTKMEQSRCKLGATPKWSAHAGWSNQCGEDSAVSTAVPPWRNRSLLADYDNENSQRTG